MSRWQIALVVVVSPIVLTLFVDALQSAGWYMHDAERTAAWKRADYYAEVDRPCRERGGLPVRSAWDGRLIDCKPLPEKTK